MCLLKRPCLVKKMKKSDNEKKYFSKNPLKRLMLRSFQKRILTLAEKEILPQSKVADIGCGEGFMARLLWNHFPNLQLTALDYAAQAIAKAKQNAPKEIHFLQGDIYQLPFADKSFAVTFCLEVLEHLQTPEKALAELCRVTDRTLILSVPHEPFFCLGNLLSGKNISRLGNPQDHINFFTLSKLKKFLQQNLSSEYQFEIHRGFVWNIAIIKRA